MTGSCRWVPCASYSCIPDDALRGGTDVDGDAIYVGRACHAGDLLPAKVIPAKHACYVPYGGSEVSVETFEVLVPAKFHWVYARDGHVPHHAIEVGETSDCEKLYVGRVHRGNHTTPGKIHPSHGCCYYPFEGDEQRSEEYECLVFQ